MAAVSGENEDKCPKRLKNDGDDYTFCLSDLPDEILLHILSSLPTTNSVVATSVLSRRWQHLWKYIPNLQLNEFQFNPQQNPITDKFQFNPQQNPITDKFQFNQQRDRFINFAERALAVLGSSSLVSFSLSSEVKNDASRINNWIRSAVQCDIEQLSLDLQYGWSSFCLPCCLFVCQTLVKLDLNLFLDSTISAIRFPSVICLPSLKHLKLTKVEFADTESAERLLSHPSLEELIFCNCDWFKASSDVNVNSPKLQRLLIEDRDLGIGEETQICFIGDNLRFFWYEGILSPTQYCICGSTMQLREAGIVFDDQVTYNIGGVAGKRYCELINSLSMAQNLTLSDPAAKHFYDYSGRPKLETTTPVFERVTRLNLSSYFYPTVTIIDSAHLRMIFHICPYLEHLNFMKVELYYRNVDSPLLKQLPLCFLTHLKKISIRGYDSECKEQAEAIHLLLQCALILEEMVLHCKIDSRIYRQKVAEFERELNMRPKVSENCRVCLVLE